MRKPSFNWTHFDLYLMFVSVLTFMMSKATEAFVPTGRFNLSARTQFSALATAIISALWYFVKRFERLELFSQHATTAGSFGEGFDIWLEPYKDKINDLLVCAYTSHTFQYLLWARRRVHLQNVRILLFFEEVGPSQMPGRLDNKDLCVDQTVEDWRRMQRDGQIDHLEIRKRPTNASFFFGVTNRERMLRGLLWPRTELGGLEPGRVWIFGQESKSMRSSIEEHSQWFEKMWNSSEPVWPSPTQE